MKNFSVLCVFFMVSCSPKVKDITLNDHFYKSISDTPEIIATQFKDKGIDRVPVVLLDDPRYNNAYLFNDSIYFDYDLVNRVIAISKLHSGNIYSFLIIRDTGKIKQLFEKYKTVYSGQNRIIYINTVN